MHVLIVNHGKQSVGVVGSSNNLLELNLWGSYQGQRQGR